MEITLTWQSLITASAFLGAAVALVTFFAKAVRWMDRQNQQDSKIESLRDELKGNGYDAFIV